MQARAKTPSRDTSDVVVVGAGILGLAVAREFLLRRPGLSLTVLEKEDGIARHQTGHNSGVIHSGIYYVPGSLKARLCVEGAALMYDYCAEKGIPVERCGKVVVAAAESDLEPLEELHRRGLANGVPCLEAIGPERLRELEPNVVGVRALYSPATGIVDFREVAAALATDVKALGAEILTGHPVTGIRSSDTSVRVVETARGMFSAGNVITCGGLYSDRLATLTGAPAIPKIVPFRGSYYLLRPAAAKLVNGLVYPVPDPAFPFLGVHFTKQISGEVWAGPNAVLAFAREGYRRRDVRPAELWETVSYRGFRALARRYWRAGVGEVWGEVSKSAFVRALRRLVPDIAPADLLPGPSGVRAQALDAAGRLLDDFWLDEAEGVTHVRNAPSPGATSSLAIARSIVTAAEARFDLPAPRRRRKKT
jgi:(S)-2-hydroxyglutarate dehydrogenase